MILIADSGSTKTSWVYSAENSNPKFISTSGINPFFRTSNDIFNELKEKLLPEIQGKVGQIHFYGAGVINEEQGNVVKSPLMNLFPKASIEVHSDLLAAARAGLQHQKGIACILGTGSNSCLYDGENIVSHIPPLGFILGDEGSGAVLGRKLVGDYLKKLMPETLAEKFRQKYPLDYAGFLNRVYREEKPNKFLATLVPFLKENISTDYCRKLVVQSFEEFINRNVKSYPGYNTFPISFVGSVAWYFQEQLKETLGKMDLQCGTILKEPLEQLHQFHLEK